MSRGPRRAKSAAAVSPPPPPLANPARVRWMVWALFALGLLLRLPAFTGPHIEGDEVIYHGLVSQIDSGAGYHLVGLKLADDIFPAEQFSHPLFYHPPAGIAAFWLLWKIFGAAGFGLAQLLSYAAFFWAVRAFAAAVLGPLSPRAELALAALAATTPIVAHVTTKHWLDGPLIAMATVAAAAWVTAFRSRGLARCAGAGALLGLASLVKTTALVTLPGLVLVAWACQERLLPDRRWFACAGLAVLAALAVQFPWELWQWIVLGSPLPYWAGKPVERLVTENPYIWFVTVHRRPWVYLQLLPICVWTTLPLLLALAILGPADRQRRMVMALALWVAVVVAAHVGLGAMGYSKLLRYVILITPAMLALAAWGADRLGERARSPRGQGWRAALMRPLAVLFWTGLALEVVQGIATAFGDPTVHMVVSLLDTLGVIEQP